jgi:small subunit ribosomal protein S4
MARYTGPSCKLCRREKTKLFLKGDRCLNGKCSLEKRPTAPGQHGAGNVKVKEYGKQLREKQKAKRYYGLQEGQFKSYFKEADRVDGVTGENLLILLERRFDNVVYRMGMAESRKEARQLVLHEHFELNGKKVNIPSIIVSAGDVVAVRENFRSSAKCKELAEGLESKNAPKWLAVDKNALSAKVVALPAREDIDFEFNEQLIVELYSK